MKMLHSLRLATLAAVALFTAHSAQAVVAGFDDIQFWAGSGSNETAMVIQWNDGSDPVSLVWGYRWESSETVTVASMLFAIASTINVTVETTPPTEYPTSGLDGRLSIALNYYASFDDYLLTGISYDQAGLDSQDFSQITRSQSGYGTNGESWTLYDLGAGASWPGTTVLPANDGMSTLSLANGGWYGWAYTVAFDPEDDYAPVPYTFDQPMAAPIPEPSVAILALGGCAFVFWLRRNREKCSV